MAHTVPYYRLYLNEKIRKFLGINLNYKKIYVFKLNNRVYLSTDTIPKTSDVIKINVLLGERNWYLNIPITYLDYEPEGYKLLNTRGRVLELTPKCENKK